MDQRPALGHLGEDAAAGHLRRRGWRVLARRWRGPFGGELDLVASRGRVLAVCEVKVRRRAETGAYPPVSARQRQRVVAGAEAFLATHPQFAGHAVHLDLLTVRPGPPLRVEHWPRGLEW